MADPFRRRIRFRPTAVGAAALILPLALLFRGISSTGTPALVVGIGLPTLVLLSLLFLLSSTASILRTARNAKTCGSALPGSWEIGRPVKLVTDPVRSSFLPGIRLSVSWRMSFGPFRFLLAAPLPPGGSGTANLVFSRRGEWTGSSFIRATDPFGFFVLECPCGTPGTVSVPPSFAAIEGADIPGRPDSETATAPRRREDAEERLERRAYVRGDDPRRLDWKLYARTGEMLVRVGEAGIPFKGRIWLKVVSPQPSRYRKKRQIRRLDLCLESAMALIQSLEDGGQEVRVILPGETDWSGTDDNWENRLAGCFPTPTDATPTPKSGERYWIIAHPEEDSGRKSALDARNRGCRISLGYPAGTGRPLTLSGLLLRDQRDTGRIFETVDFRQYRRKLVFAEKAAEKEGIDARRI